MDYGRIKKWFIDDGYDGEEYEEDSTVEPSSIFESKSDKATQTVKSLSGNKEGHLVLFEPRSFSEATEIADYLKNKRATVINLHRLQKEQSKRVIDFLSGVIYAIDGDIQQIGPKIFLCTPRNINVSGSISVENDENDE